MITTENIKIKTTNKNITYYKSIFKNINSGDIINIKPHQLPNTSKIKIDCKCSICNNILNISYHSYLRNISNYGYYTCKSCSYDKNKKTNIVKYGTEHPMKNYNVKSKLFKIKKEKIVIRKLYDNNRKKYRLTCLNRYGVDNPMKNNIIKNKFKMTMFKKYGVYVACQLEKFYNKMLISGFKIKYHPCGIYYQGSYEKNFLDRYYNSLNITRGKNIEYIYNNTKHIYYSDFYIKEYNLIVEIKSSRWLKLHENKNKEKEIACKKLGYNFIFIIDKNYIEFDKYIKKERI